MKEFIKKYFLTIVLLLFVGVSVIYGARAPKDIIDFTNDVIEGDIVTSDWVKKVNTQKAPLQSPKFTGDPTAPMPNKDDDDFL